MRFREEIYAILQLIADRKEGVNTEDLRNLVLRLRLEREDRRLKAVRKSVTLEDRKRKRARLLTKVEQMIRVLRKTELVSKRDDVFCSTENSRQLVSLKEKDEISADSFFLTRLVNSGFSTYWLFLKELYICKELRIPASIPKRDVTLREFICKRGFPLDAWSFFILRDLFYDFSLLNYIIEDGAQVIFPLYAVQDDSQETSMFKYRVQGPEGYLWFWPQDPPDFINGLVNIYLSESDNKWNRMIDLIRLRERYSYRFRMPERQFDILLQQSLKAPTRYKIALSVGPLDTTAKSTYITKALTLSHNRLGLPYSMIRIGVGE